MSQFSHRGQSLPEALGSDDWIDAADLSSQRLRTDFVERHPELVRHEVVSQLAGLVPQLVKSDRNRALDIAEVSVLFANRLDDMECQAQSLRAKANALYSLGQNKAAIEHHRKALHLFRIGENSEQVARTLSSLIQPLILQGHYNTALAAAREAHKIFTKQGNRWRLARLELNVGNIFDRQERFAQALRCYRRAYQYLAANQQDDPEAVAVALHNMAVSYVSLNDFRKAETTYEKARSFAAEYGLVVLVGQADYNIASLHFLRGDYRRAISMLLAARELCRKTGDAYHVALCHLDLSEVYLELNLNLEAAEAAEHAGDNFNQLGMQYEKGKSILNLAIAMSRQGKAERAIELLVDAREIFKKEKNSVLPAVADLHRAAVLANDKRESEARRLSMAALRTFQGFRLSDRTSACRLVLARLDLRARNLDAARRQCRQALTALSRLELPALSCQAHALRGQIEAAAGDERRAYSAYVRAREYLERLRSGIHGDELRISFMKDRAEIYEALVDLRLRHSNRAIVKPEIFGLIQQAKSRTLLDIISTSRLSWWSPPESDETAHAKRIRQLREELNWYFRAAEKAELQQASPHHLLELRAEALNRERELLRLEREQVARQGPESQVQLSTTLTVDQIRELMPADTVILEYFQAKGRVVVALLSHAGIDIIPLGDGSRVATSVEFLRFQLSKLRMDTTYAEILASTLLNGTRNHLHDLYEILVEPIRRRLSGLHLVLAPHGVLHGLPFHALFDGQRYLIEEFTVSYAPSASVYALCQARRQQAQDGCLVVGVPDPAVPFVKQEVEAVAACLPDAELLLGNDVSSDRLREQCARRRILHIATHGYFRRDNPMFSSIRLGDSYLSLYDLEQWRLSAELVTLSGCSTGLNVVSGGDELLGLARGLIRAGAATSMLTLWDVQDQSSAQLMTRFYRNLAGGCSNAVALQRAMLGLKLERPHPYYWAPFVLVGKA